MNQTEIRTKRSFVDPFFKPEYKGSYFLSLQLGRDGLYIAVLDAQTNTYMVLEEHLFEGVQNPFQTLSEFEKYAAAIPLLKRDYEKIVVGIINEFSSLVPEALFDESFRSNYLEFTQGKEMPYMVYDERLVNIKARNLFALPEGFRESLLRKFPMASIIHASTPLIDGLSLLYKQREGEVAAIHIQYSHFEILYFKNGVMNYFNSFNYTTAEDFIYYTLFAFEQLGLNTEKITVEVFGEVDADSSTYNLLYKYVRDVSFGKRPGGLNYSPALDVLSNNHYYSLFQQLLCV